MFSPSSCLAGGVLAIIAVTAVPANVARADSATPWRLASALGLPSWLELGINHRTRYEHLLDDFRSAHDGDSSVLVMRTLLAARLRFDPVSVGFELQDSRAFATDETPLNTTVVNPLELLQAYAGVRRKGLLAPGDVTEVKLGRITMDVGSRRLVARNKFRNTINGFTGFDARWTSRTEHVARLFAVMPVTRLPSANDALHDNEIELDEENTDTLLWGVYYSTPAIVLGGRVEALLLGLHEKDGDVASRNRQLYTATTRAVRKKQRGKLDYELEGSLQVGKSRTNTAADNTTDLDHFAYFVHAQVGFTIDHPWKPRLLAQYDYASGDDDPNDDANNRFDTLFGARRWELGPTGIYGPFFRANLNTPGGRVEIAPSKTLDGFLAYRLFWLASATDAWTGGSLRDPTGGSGKFLGHQVEGRVRLHVLPGNLTLEVGAAHLIRGRFAKEAPMARDEAATELYTQIIGKI